MNKFNDMKIVIDNGHGVNTKGKSSPDGTLKEYAWSREIAKRVTAALLSLGYDAERIVPEEIDVPISTRVNRINSICKQVGANNVLLVSIHNNAAGNGTWNSANGFSVFVSKNSSANSKKCAKIFTDEAIKLNLIGNRFVPTEKYWTWNWTVNDIGILKKSNCPAVLTENMFMDNKSDCEFLLTEYGKQTMVDLHVNAIIKYIKSL